MKEVRLMVNLKLRHPISKSDLNQHVREALLSWGGSLHPDDPLFNGIAAVTVKTWYDSVK